MAKIEGAYDFAAKCHADQLRRSGDPVITHPLHAAQTIASLADIGGAGGLVTNSSGGTSATLTFGAASGVTSFSGIIADGASPIAVGKTGGGTQILAGPNAYTGKNAARAGLRKGDIVVSVAKKRDFKSVSDFHAWFRLTQKPGTKIQVQARRNMKLIPLRLAVLK